MTTTQSTVRKLELRNGANVDRQVLILTSHLMYRQIDGYHCCYTIQINRCSKQRHKQKCCQCVAMLVLSQSTLVNFGKHPYCMCVLEVNYNFRVVVLRNTWFEIQRKENKMECSE